MADREEQEKIEFISSDYISDISEHNVIKEKNSTHNATYHKEQEIDFTQKYQDIMHKKKNNNMSKKISYEGRPIAGNIFVGLIVSFCFLSIIFFIYLSLNKRSDLNYRKAISEHSKKNYVKAINLYQEFCEKYPDHDLADDALYYIGACKENLNSNAEAITAYKYVIKSYPKREKASYAQFSIAQNYMNQRLFDQAIDEFNKYISRYSNAPFVLDAYHHLAKCYEKKELFDDAIQTLIEAMNLESNYEIYKDAFLIAKLYYKQGMFNEAENMYNKVLNDSFVEPEWIKKAERQLYKIRIAKQAKIKNYSKELENKKNAMVDDIIEGRGDGEVSSNQLSVIREAESEVNSRIEDRGESVEDIKRKNEKNVKLNKALGVLHSKIVGMEKEKDQYMQWLSQQQNAMANIKKMVFNLEKEKKIVEAKVRNLKDKVGRQEIILEETKQLAESEKKRLKSKMQNLKTKLERTDNDKDKDKILIAKLAANNEILQKKILNEQKNLKGLKKQKKGLIEQIEQISEHLKITKNEWQSLMENIEDARKEVFLQKEVNETLKKEFYKQKRDLSSQLEKAKKQIKDKNLIKRQKNEALNNIEKLKQKLDDVQTQRDKFKDESVKMHNELRKLKNKLDILSAQKENLSAKQEDIFKLVLGEIDISSKKLRKQTDNNAVNPIVYQKEKMQAGDKIRDFEYNVFLLENENKSLYEELEDLKQEVKTQLSFNQKLKRETIVDNMHFIDKFGRQEAKIKELTKSFNSLQEQKSMKEGKINEMMDKIRKIEDENKEYKDNSKELLSNAMKIINSKDKDKDKIDKKQVILQRLPAPNKIKKEKSNKKLIVDDSDNINQIQNNVYQEVLQNPAILKRTKPNKQKNIKTKTIEYENKKPVKKGIQPIPSGITKKAEKYFKSGKIEEALKIYELLYDKKKIDKFSLNNLGLIYSQKGNFSKAVLVFKDLIKIDPKNKNVYINLSVIYMSTSNFLQASNVLKKAIAIFPNDEELRYNLALSYESIEDTKNAFLQYEYLFKLAPENDIIKQKIESLRKQL